MNMEVGVVLGFRLLFGLGVEVASEELGVRLWLGMAFTIVGC